MSRALTVFMICLCLAAAAAARAHAPVPPPDLRQRAGFVQRLGAQVPMDASFTDADGHVTTLRKVADGKPLILAMGYYHCPNLCQLMLDAMAHAVADMHMQPGRDFSVVFISIDPQENPAAARSKREQLAARVPAARVPKWHLLTGDAASIQRVAKAIGYSYFYDPSIEQFAHPSGLVVLSANGKVTQYLFGMRYLPETLHLALVNASAGHLGSVVDRLVLLCCGYDPQTGRYSLLIGRVMQIIGCGFALLLIGFLFVLRRRHEHGRGARA